MGGRELGKLCDIYGAEVLQGYLSSLLDYTEQMTREEIRGWPKGTFRFTDYIDDDGMDDRPIPITVAITVHEDSVTVDYEGTSPQVRGAINATLSYTHSCTYLSVRCALKGDVPNNAGIFRCITVKAPAGSVLNPLPPAAVAARALTGYRLCDVMFGALAQIVPDRIPAGGEGGNTVVCLAGLRPNREPFIIVDMICGAWGGRPDRDGVDAITNPSQNLSNTPVETLEAQYPIRIEEYGLIPDSCGAGEWRGGLGVRRTYQLLADTAQLQLRSDRAKFPPYGLAGGEPALATANYLVIDGEKKASASKITMGLERDATLIHEQAGGGGFGDALLRDPAKVGRDVWNGKITPEYAERWHGVIVDPMTGSPSLAATDELRRSRRSLKLAS